MFFRKNKKKGDYEKYKYTQNGDIIYDNNFKIAFNFWKNEFINYSLDEWSRSIDEDEFKKLFKNHKCDNKFDDGDFVIDHKVDSDKNIYYISTNIERIEQ